MFINVLPGSHHVFKRVFLITESQVHQATGGVIHEYQKTAFWGSAFEPVMVRSIVLNQFPKIVVAIAWLVNPGSPAGMRTPETVGCHPVTDGFNGELNMMAFRQFFGCELCSWKILPTGELNRVPSFPMTSNFGWSNWLHDQMPTSHNWRGNMALIITHF